MKSKDQKRKEGEERNRGYSTMTPAEKLHDLDQRLGVGVGAKRQRAKLEGLLPPKPEVVDEPIYASLSEKKRVEYMKAHKREEK
jgi:hypothetical protein